MNRSLRVLGILNILLCTLPSLVSAAIIPPTVLQPLQKAVLEPASTLTIDWSVLAEESGDESVTAFDLFVRDSVSKEIVWRNRELSKANNCNNNGECSLVLSLNLPESKNHYLRIKSKSDTGQSVWSAVRYFSVLNPERHAPELPVVLSPANKSIVTLGSPIEVSWQLVGDDNPLQDPTAYDFLVYDQLSRSVVTRELNVSGISCDFSRQCSYSLPNLLPEAVNHIVRLRARNLAGASSWTPVRRFSVFDAERMAPSTPIITVPSLSQAFEITQTLNFEWIATGEISGPAAPSEFDVFIYDTGKKIFLWRDKNASVDSHCDDQGVCSVVVPVTIPASEDYVFRVKAKNLAGASSWSNSARFSVYEDEAFEVAGSCTAVADATEFFAANISHLVSGGSAPYTYELNTSAARGTVDLDYNSGSFNYYPTDSGRGYLDGFDVKVRDQNDLEAIARISFVYGTRRIMPVGDSITFGVLNYNSTTGDFPLSANAVGYRKHLSELLQAGGYATEFVGPRSSGASAGLGDSQHAGYPGWTSLHIANGRAGHAASGHLTQWLDNHAADILLIHAGTNDYSTSTYGVGQILAKADAWRASNNLPLISMTATLVDQRRDHWNRNHLDIFNSMMPLEVAAVSSARLVDMFPVLDWRDDLTTYPTDITGLHPNAGGYLKMAEHWYQSMVDEGVVNKCP